MSKCQSGYTWSYTKKKCMSLSDYQIYLQQLLTDRDTSRLQIEQGAGVSTGFDPLGVNAFFDKIGQNIVSILVIGLGLALVVVAGQGYVTGGSIKVPGLK